MSHNLTNKETEDTTLYINKTRHSYMLRIAGQTAGAIEQKKHGYLIYI